ncbi:MAG: hypothetical protein ACO1RX_11015 [Candidatus Sericytochromatia bacterium]
MHDISLALAELQTRLNRSVPAQSPQQQLQQLEHTRSQLLARLPEISPLSLRLQQALGRALQEAELEHQFSQRRRDLNERRQDPVTRAQAMQTLEARYHQQRALLPVGPELSLEEQEQLLQALMRHAAEQYVDQALQQLRSRIERSAA